MIFCRLEFWLRTLRTIVGFSITIIFCFLLMDNLNRRWNNKRACANEYILETETKIESELIVERNNISRLIKTFHHRRRRPQYDNTPPMAPNDQGYMGRGADLRHFPRERERKGYRMHAFNLVASDRISLQRTLKDFRNRK